MHAQSGEVSSAGTACAQRAVALACAAAASKLAHAAANPVASCACRAARMDRTRPPARGGSCVIGMSAQLLRTVERAVRSRVRSAGCAPRYPQIVQTTRERPHARVFWLTGMRGASSGRKPSGECTRVGASQTECSEAAQRPLRTPQEHETTRQRTLFEALRARPSPPPGARAVLWRLARLRASPHPTATRRHDTRCKASASGAARLKQLESKSDLG